MAAIKQFMTEDHRACDSLFTEVENRVAQGEWDEVDTLFVRFAQAMERHFSREEAVMFPAFESKIGSSAGPTQVMRMEHAQMRQVLEDMKKDILVRDKNHALGLSETLMILLQQHNMKEEQMLYSMVEMHIEGSEGESLLAQMKAL